MSGWTTHSGVAIALDIESVDTDQLIPARFMSTPRTDGYGRFLLHDMRFDAHGAPLSTFPLNRHPKTSVLITRRNFGSGSSREAAVYALVDFGIRVVIAPSFGDIFASNAINNGLLPAQIDSAVCDTLLADLGEDDTADARINVSTRTLNVGDHTCAFSLDPVWQEKLINGWDDIDLTQQHLPAIAAYRKRLSNMQPWAFPSQETAK